MRFGVWRAALCGAADNGAGASDDDVSIRSAKPGAVMIASSRVMVLLVEGECECGCLWLRTCARGAGISGEGVEY